MCIYYRRWIVTEASITFSIRLISRDIGGSDPERMAPPNAAVYVQEAFKDTPVKVIIIH